MNDQERNSQTPETAGPEGGSQVPSASTHARIKRIMGVRSRVGDGRGRKRRWLRAVLVLVVGLTVLLGGAGYVVFQIQNERNSAFLREGFLDLVNRALGPGHEVSLQSARLEFAGFAPRFTLDGLSILNTQTRGAAQLEQASFSLSPFSLWRFSPEARVVRFSGLALVLPDSDAAATTLQAQEVLALLRGTLGAVHIAISGEDSSFASLRAVDGEQISIFRRSDKGKAVAPLQSGLALHVGRTQSGFTAAISRPGSEALSMSAQRVEGDAGPEIVLETGDVKAGALFSLIGGQVAGVDPSLTLNLRLVSRMNKDGALAESGIRIGARGGQIILPDPDMVPFHLDEAALELAIKPGESELAVRRLMVRFNETHIEAHGTLTPLGAVGQGLRLRLVADKALLDRLSPTEDVVELDAADAEGELSADLTSFRLDRLDLAEDDGRARMTGRFSIAGGGLIETRLEGGGFLLRKALRIWPVWVAPNVRLWLIDHVKSGRLTSVSMSTHLEGEALANAFAKRPVPDEALSFAFRVDDGAFQPLSDAQPLTRAAATGVVSGRRAQFQIEQGQVDVGGKIIRLGASRLQVADTARKPALLDMTLPAKGRLDALVAYLNAPSLRSITGLPENITVTEGQFDGVAQITVPLGVVVAPKDTKVEMKGDLTGVVVENVIKGEKLEGSSLTMLSKAGTLSVKGDARLFGVPGQVELRVEPKGAIAQVKMTLDDAALAKKGIDLRPTISGPLGVTASLPLGKADAAVDFDIDLAKAKIAAPVPGITKAAGQAGRAKFSLKANDSSQMIEGLEADFGTLSLRGKLELGKDGAFNRVDLGTFKLSGGDNARLVAEKSGKGFKINLRGNSFDARPFLKGLQSGRMESSGTPVDFDLDLATTVLVGFGGELLTGAELKLGRRSGQLTEIDLKGNFAGALTRVTSAVQGKNTQLKVTSDNGGALARFLDLYSRAHGGTLVGEITLLPNNGQRGLVQMREFTLRGESGLRSVSSNARDGQAVMQGTDDVPFTKMRAVFLRKPGRLEVAEAVMWGPQVGGSLEGYIDYAADSVSIKGTFVPAYALNNLFAQVPLLGPILGGGQYEGLFAVPFIITGRASAPELKTNPVSVIAPGFLRKIFEIRKESQ